MTTGDIIVRRSVIEDLDLVVPLFDGYRQFYRQPSDPERARHFLGERLEQNQSVIFVAFADGAAVGFTQLYPSFSSGTMRRTFILNDLFVAPDARRRGIGSALLDAAAAYGKVSGALRLVLSTETGNSAAQSLCEAKGRQRDTEFCVFRLAL